MNSYTLTVAFLAAASALKIWCSALAIEDFLRHRTERGLRRIWLAVAAAAMLLALHDGYALELAARTGLYDLRQAILVGLAALMMTFVIHSVRQREA